MPAGILQISFMQLINEGRSSVTTSFMRALQRYSISITDVRLLDEV